MAAPVLGAGVAAGLPEEAPACCETARLVTNRPATRVRTSRIGPSIADGVILRPSRTRGQGPRPLEWPVDEAPTRRGGGAPADPGPVGGDLPRRQAGPSAHPGVHLHGMDPDAGVGGHPGDGPGASPEPARFAGNRQARAVAFGA